jgi:hypothetical protein
LKDYKNAQVDFSSYLISCRYHTTDFLNEEVEIIVDEPKDPIITLRGTPNSIRKDLGLPMIEHFYFSVYQDQKLGGREVVEPLETELNEIIDKINGE